MPKGVYDHANRAKKIDIVNFMTWYVDKNVNVILQNRSSGESSIEGVRKVIQEYEQETGNKINLQTAYKNISKYHLDGVIAEMGKPLIPLRR